MVSHNRQPGRPHFRVLPRRLRPCGVRLVARKVAARGGLNRIELSNPKIERDILKPEATPVPTLVVIE